METNLTNPYEVIYKQNKLIIELIKELNSKLIKPAEKRPRFYQREEIQKMTGWTDAKIYGKVHRKQLPVIKDGKRLLFPADKFHELMERLAVKVKMPGE